MRKIEFRGIAEDNKWYYGNLKTNIYMGGWIHGIQFGNDNENNDDDISLYNVDILKNETIGQYTGIKDKHNKKIYEGDIVRVSEEYGGASYIPLVVDFKDGCFVLKPINNLSAYNPIFEYDFTQIYEIIGNKFDNPELMEF